MFIAVPRWQLALIASGAGALTGLGHSPFDMPLATLAGLIAAFALFAQTDTARRAALLGWSFGTGYFALTLHWIVEPFLVDLARHGWMAPFALVFLSTGLALFWGAAFGAARVLGRQPVLLALTLTAAEVCRAYVFTGFPWAMLSYPWVDTLPAHAAAFLGPHGLTAALLILTASIANGSRLIQAGSLVLAIALTFAPAPVLPDPAADRPMIRIVQPNAPQHQKWDPDHIPTFFDRKIAFTASDPAPDLVVWPETSVPTWLHNAQPAFDRIAEASEVPVVVGIQRLEPPLSFYNSLVVLGADAQITARYDKHHLVPFGEYVPFGELMARFGIHGLAANEGGGYSAGPGPQLIDLGPLGTALPLICYEGIFPHMMRGLTERPGFLLLITNDAWFGNFAGPQQHLAQARMRAIEQGLPMVRSANTGISAMIDARGRMLSQIPLNQAGYVDAALPEALPPTVYARTGDWPVLGFLVVVLGALTLRRFRKSD